jgi:diguanylate cyclase (GGDEF)-like protein
MTVFMTPDALLQQIIKLTGTRDQEALDAAMVCALFHIADAFGVTAHSLVDSQQGRFVLTQARMSRSQSFTGAQIEAPAECVPLAQCPIPPACIGQGISEEQALAGRGILWLPVWLDGRMAGCFRIEHAMPLPMPAASRKLLNDLLSIYLNHRRLIDYSERDSLTGLLNRKTFDSQFTRLAQAGMQERQPMPDGAERRCEAAPECHWLGVADIDFFKKINDRFGHLYGDEVLILAANIMKSSFRAHDRIFRFGGEEFVILLRSVSLQSARNAFERFRQTVERHSFPQLGQVTVSLGFVGISAKSPVVMLGQADEALYYAKQHGRNQVRYYADLISAGALQPGTANQTAELF